jgi:hypothetical protein
VDVNYPDYALPDEQVWWSSDRAGRLGTGHEIAVRLAQGTHVITAHCTDGTTEVTDDVRIVIEPRDAGCGGRVRATRGVGACVRVRTF